LPKVAEAGGDWPKGEQNFVIGYCQKWQKKEVIGQKVSRTLSLVNA